MRYAVKCAGVEKSAASATKNTKKERKKPTSLPDLTGLSKVLDDLLPEIKSQEKKAATVSGTKYKRASVRKKLLQNEQDRLVAIFATTEFQQDPIGAVGNFLESTLEQPQSQKVSVAVTKQNTPALSKKAKTVK